MAFIPVPNVLQAELVYNQNGQITENTLYFELTTTPTREDMLQLGGILRDWWNTWLAPNIHTGTSLTLIRIRDLTTQNSPGLDFVTGLPLAGSAGGSPAPNNVTAAASFRTDFSGRSFRGRNYIAGLTLSNVANQQLTAGVPAVFEAAYEALIVELVTTPFVWVVVSRYTNGAPRVSGLTTPITQVTVDPTLDSQRRRLPGRGD